MDAQQLRCFLEVADRRSFSQAAEALFLSQPAVTYQVARLEEELGFPLFDRRSRKIALTSGGRVFYRRAGHLLGEMDRIVREAKQKYQASQGVVTCGHFYPENDAIFPGALRAFQEHCPGTGVTVKLPFFAELCGAVTAGDLDGAVVPEGYLPRQREALDADRLYEAREFCVMAREHPLAGREKVTLKDIAQAGYIAPPQKLALSVMSPTVRYLCSHRDEFLLETVNGTEEATFLAAIGRGVLISVGRSDQLPYGLIQRPIEGSRPVGVYFIRRKGGEEGVEKLADFLVQYYARNFWGG